MDFTLGWWIIRAITSMRAEEYDEEQEIIRYINENYRYLWTKRELRLEFSAISFEKEWLRKSHDDGLDPEEAKSALLKESEYADLPELVDLFTEGRDIFNRRAAERIKNEYGGQFFVNRCPKCDRIVASPIACTCLWCGATWYEERKEIEKLAQSAIYPYKSG
jgi:hypothetical protein